MAIDLNNPDLVKLVRDVARSTSSSFPSYISADDVEQDIWLWVLKNKNTVSKAFRDAESWQAMLRPLMVNAANTSIKKEEAAVNLYSEEDVFEYSTKVIRTLLDDVFDYEDWQSFAMVADGMPKAKGQANETGDRQAMLADVNRAVNSLGDDQYNLILWRYKYRMTIKELAEYHEVSESAAKDRLSRAVKAIQRALGKKSFADMRQGFSERYRASVGNAQAGYITERNYEG